MGRGEPARGGGDAGSALGYGVRVASRSAAGRRRGLARAVVLIQVFGEGLTEVMARTLSPRATSNEEARTLLGVKAAPAIRPGELADRLGVLPAAMSRSLRNLQAAHLVERRPGREDGRAISLHLSRRGKAAVGRLDVAVGRYLSDSDTVLAELVSSLGGAADAARMPDGLAVIDEIARVSAPLVADVRTVYRAHGSTVRHRSVVMSLFAGLCEPRPSALAEYLGWTRPRVTAALMDLESGGLLERHPGADGDQRGIELILTAAGEDLARDAQAALGRHAAELADCLEGARLLGMDRHGAASASPA
jgi:DNA-binding MarR family transcriptional regulator